MPRSLLRYTVLDLKPTQLIVLTFVVLLGTGTLGYGLAQTSTTVFYIASEAHAAEFHIAPLLYQRTTSPTMNILDTLPLSKTILQPKKPVASSSPASVPTRQLHNKIVAKKSSIPAVAKPTPAAVFTVPFISQLSDITAPKWKKIGCGIASLAMIINFHESKSVEVNGLLEEGIKAGAYSEAGWIYSGLIAIAKKHGLDGEAFDLGWQTTEKAFADFSQAVAKGPVMASVHYKFEPTNPIPHLVVVTGIKDNLVYYNDPASTGGGLSIPLETFKAAWKRRYLEFYPVS